jgi:signal transduction histidine kinase/ActR/RegA family two-component response regulator
MRQEVDYDSVAGSPLTAGARESSNSADRFEMDPSASSFASPASWTGVNQHSHLVQFYENDGFLVDALTRWFADGLNGGDSCVFVGTESHRIRLQEKLADRGFDLDGLRTGRRFVCLDAAQVLSTFMVDEWPNEGLFIRAIEGVLGRVSKPREIRVFGEMVALLWADGKRQAAVRLEEMWNAFMKTHALSLCCAYPLHSFSCDADASLFLKVCAQHTQVLPAESYTALTTEAERLRAISLLQHEASVLETEKAGRKEAEQSLVELEQMLKIRLAELALADQRRNEFLAMLGHELRNPLSAVLDAIATAQLDQTRRERALTIARRQTDQLAGLVDDLLDVGRITQGRIVLKKEAVKVASILKQAVEEAQCLVEPGQHRLSVRMSSGAEEAVIEADPARMRQVIANLIHNAAKFTPAGGCIDVLAERAGDEIVLRVRDSGIGISPDLLPRVFDLFTQAERPLDRSHGGLGIGLTLVKRLVEMHGGRVEAHSAGPGMGSEFEVRITAAKDSGPETTATVNNRDEHGHLRIVVVEDNFDAAEALKMLLELFGHQTTVVENGLAAIDAVRHGAFDLGLVDIGLPGIDGYEVARRIRTIPNAKTMTLVALTGYGQETDKQRALSAGFDEHLTKPVKIERLQAVLNRPR